MPLIYVPADAEQAVIDELPGLGVGTTVPDNPPDSFIRVVQAGGTQINEVTDEFLVTLEAFAGTETEASTLLSEAIGRIDHAARDRGQLGGETCYGTRAATTPQNFPMPSLPAHRRYLVTLAVRLRRRPVTI